jgi:putative Holliday junction resolvase
MRLLALDVGTKRIGIALTDPLQVTARPHSTIDRNRQAYEKISALIHELEISKILIGLPLHLDGTEGKQAADVRSFASKLALVVPQAEIVFVDERLTSVEAEERLADRRGGWRKNKSRIDAWAAASILQNYLNKE